MSGGSVMKKILVCLVLFVAVSFGSTAFAYYEGYISWNKNLVASYNWANSYTALSWIVSFDSSSNYWTYRYTFTTDGKPGISHVITEVSATFDKDNIEEGTTERYELGTYTPYNPSNPGIPGYLYGLKFEVPAGNSGRNFSWTIVTDRAPMWGDFYAKGGSNGYVYNTEFGNTNDAPIGNNKNLFGWVLVPDTVSTVPEPETLILIGIGILFIVLTLRNIRRRKTILPQDRKE
jgi:hypothetical protein